MTQEDKQLLLVDLSARLPYGVKVNNEIQGDFEIYGLCENYIFGRSKTCHVDFSVEKIKPYLFPLSSMTEEQYENFLLTDSKITLMGVICSTKGFEFLNKHHFDYRGLIPMGLANDATGLNIY